VENNTASLEIESLVKSMVEGPNKLLIADENTVHLSNFDDVMLEVVDDCFEPAKIQLSFNWHNFFHFKSFLSEQIDWFRFCNAHNYITLDNLVEGYKFISRKLVSVLLKKESMLRQKWISACIIGNHLNLLKIMVHYGSGVEFKEFASLHYVVLAVWFAKVEVIDLILRQYSEQTGLPLQNIKTKFSLSVYPPSFHSREISIISFATLKGSVSVMKKLLEYDFDLNKIHDLLHYSVVGSKTLSDAQVTERIQMIELLVKKYPSLIRARTSDKRTPLLVPDIHVDLIMRLIDLGVDVHATDKDLRNILHICPYYMEPEEYSQIVQYLHRRGDSTLLHSQDK